MTDSEELDMLRRLAASLAKQGHGYNKPFWPPGEDDSEDHMVEWCPVPGTAERLLWEWRTKTGFTSP